MWVKSFISNIYTRVLSSWIPILDMQIIGVSALMFETSDQAHMDVVPDLLGIPAELLDPRN